MCMYVIYTDVRRGCYSTGLVVVTRRLVGCGYEEEYLVSGFEDGKGWSSLVQSSCSDRRHSLIEICWFN